MGRGISSDSPEAQGEAGEDTQNSSTGAPVSERSMKMPTYVCQFLRLATSTKNRSAVD